MSTRKSLTVAGVALAATGVLALGVNAVANAATPSPSASTESKTDDGAATDGRPDGDRPADAPKVDHDGDGPRGVAPHGAPGEKELSGDTAAKVKAAALKALPGATVVRVETDSGSAKYEAHVTTKAGDTKTVKVSADFAVIAVQDGMGKGPKGQGPHGQGPKGQDQHGQGSDDQEPKADA